MFYINIILFFEITALGFHLLELQWVFLGIYKPDKNYHKFIKIISNILNKNVRKYINIPIAGDLNMYSFPNVVFL